MVSEFLLGGGRSLSIESVRETLLVFTTAFDVEIDDKNPEKFLKELSKSYEISSQFPLNWLCDVQAHRDYGPQLLKCV